MRAPEHQRIDSGTDQWRQVAADDLFRDRVLEPALLNKGHQQGTGL